MRIRYALVLPLLHLATAVPPMVYQQSVAWRFIPLEQATENYDREHPETRIRLYAVDPVL
jgi:hypothetical protein